MTIEEQTPREAVELLEKLEKLRPSLGEVPREEKLSLILSSLTGLRSLMSLCGENPEREGLLDSPSRIIKAFMEVTSGLDQSPRDLLKRQFSFEDEYEYDQMILSRDIPFASLCEHHWLPFTGVAHVAYIPDPKVGRVVGLSKLARLVEVFAQRPQVQEKMTAQIAKTIEDELNPLGVAVVIKGRHTCQCLRGVKKDGLMVTSSLHGVFKKEPETRSEFLKMIEL